MWAVGPGSGIKYQGMNNSCPGPSQVIGAGISGDSADRRVMVEEDGTWVPAQLGSDAKAVFNPLLRSLVNWQGLHTQTSDEETEAHRWAVTCQGPIVTHGS